MYVLKLESEDKRVINGKIQVASDHSFYADSTYKKNRLFPSEKVNIHYSHLTIEA